MAHCSIILFIIFSTINSVFNIDIEHYLKLIENRTKLAYKGNSRIDAREYEPKTTEWQEYGTFDHIIVGAGSSGAVLANRLTEDGLRNVLVLEAGSEPSELSNIPGMMALEIGLDQNWNYTTTPQANTCLGMRNRECYYPRGKGLGGSTLINGLVYTRGNKENYDSWCRQGNPGWCYDDLLPLFKKSEKFLEGDSKYRGKTGNLNVECADVMNPITKAFFAANKEICLRILDYNAENQIGTGAVQLNTLNGTRQSTYKAFLEPILHRPNLRILAKSFVTNILIDKHKKALGLFFTKNQQIYLVKSRHEIILSAGNIGSAQLLMLSGIGPKDHLAQVGVPLVKNLPVGTCFEDHPYYSYLQFFTNYTEPDLNMKEMLEDYFNSSGVLTNPFNVRAVTFTHSKYHHSTLPDIELLLETPSSPKDNLPKLLNLNDETHRLVTQDNDSQNVFTIFVSILQPKSKGTIRLKSSNPFDYPLINPKMLSDCDNLDIETMYRGIQRALELADTKAFQKFNTRLKYLPHPKCTQHVYLSRQFWYCQIRHFSTSMYHSVGSCKMGEVVDSNLKVIGVKNVRVADASIMPSIVSAHTNAASIMIGEKAAQLIRST